MNELFKSFFPDNTFCVSFNNKPLISKPLLVKINESKKSFSINSVLLLLISVLISISKYLENIKFVFFMF